MWRTVRKKALVNLLLKVYAGLGDPLFRTLDGHSDKNGVPSAKNGVPWTDTPTRTQPPLSRMSEEDVSDIREGGGCRNGGCGAEIRDPGFVSGDGGEDRERGGVSDEVKIVLWERNLRTCYVVGYSCGNGRTRRCQCHRGVAESVFFEGTHHVRNRISCHCNSIMLSF